MIIEITPLDTLFFRNSKTFFKGEDTWGEGIFPPYPSVIYGALRTLYFANNMDTFEYANKEEDPTRNLKIINIILKNKRDLLFPMPLDCVVSKASNDKKAIVLDLQDVNNMFFSNYPNLSKILVAKGKVENKKNLYLSDEYFKDYINGKKEIYYSELDIMDEPKIGIARSKETHVSAESALYRIDMKRLNDVSIVVEFEGLSIPKKGILKLGGESKAAEYKVVENNLEKFDVKIDRFFKVVLTTPAIFKKGCIPSFISEENFEYKSENIHLKLLAAVVGRPLIVGGFDMKKRRAKPLYKAVPAGSVYYFELLKGDVKDLIRKFHKKAISEIYQKQGFGISYLAKI
ncbi:MULTISPECIES: type III-B CRISPR module-associated protein Cmr3 [unclassified Thermosipho (in: thermotogales)]|uniref:type III-B CRISPR module-associated protein Cmr3 n=1 Tax=unclassified Thermosipho (in: thermotogales) TaxID=2676525 RepID=UPI00098625D6|nr:MULTISPECIES: type III-B CRISPR module-associated protein Cmr3 [unclassified Thermosipho (in: thermotogales)]MBT1247058.1 hypothetical protein [Thermosipho sp. 1244]OOC46912.1 hypothetical protein XO09_04325 [Thermosipho sp. 1223]